MTRTQTMVQLTEGLLARLDGEARRRGMSRSALIREAVDAYLAESSEEAVSRAIVDGYRKVPQGTPDDWGNLLAAGDRSAAETMERLAEEEREHGGGEW